MKKILGLDIGTTSIGWAIVEATDEKKINERTNEIAVTDINNDRIGIHKDAIGVRIISQDTTNIQSFNEGKELVKGSTLTPTASRRVKRGSRRLKSRYKLRRDKLMKILEFINILPIGAKFKDENKKDIRENSNYYTNTKGKRGDNNDIGKAIYELRDRAIREKISLNELGRILLHLNQWRGYSSDRFAIKEKKFNYNICEITNIDWVHKKAIYDKNDKEKKEPKYYEVVISLRFEEIIKVDYEVENNGTKEEATISLNEVNNGIIYLKNELKVGNHITVKVPKYVESKDKKGSVIKRFYKIEKTEPEPDDTDYQRIIFNKTLSDFCNTGGTVGSYFYKKHYLERVENSRIRNNIVDRDWYEQEFDKIWDFQFEHHKDFFEKIDIENFVKIAFKDYHAILTQIKNLQIEFEENGEKKKRKATKSEQLKCLFKDKIIFFQRPWQQAKNKGQCPFEKIKVKKEVTIKESGKKEIVEVHIGRTVIPRSHPLFQEFKIWQQINNVRIYLTTSDGKIDLFDDEVAFKNFIEKDISEVKQLLFEALQNSKSKSWKSFAENELELKKKEIVDKRTGEIIKYPFSYNFNKRKKDGTNEEIKLKGNTTKVSLQNSLKDIIKQSSWFDEIHSEKQRITNLQLLWEIIYDITISDANKVAEIIKTHFGFDEAICLQLAKLKFDDAGMGNLSAKAIRNILPMMSNGTNLTEKAKKKIASLIVINQSEEEKDKEEKLESLRSFITDKKARLRLSKFDSENAFTYLNYWEATAVMYGSHSTKNTVINPEHKISRVENHSMNNPIVEKIVNETISIVNEIYKRYAERDLEGNILIDENDKPKMGFDEVRIELSRELKASMEERKQMWEGMQNNEKRNELAKKMLRELFNADASSNNITKLKIYEDEAKQMTKERFEELKNKGEITKNTDFEKFEDVAKKINFKEPSKSDLTRYQLWLDQMYQCPYTGETIRLSDIFTSKYEIEHIIPRARYLDNSYSNKVITRRIINDWKKDRLAYEFIIQEGGKTIVDNKTDGKTLTILQLDKKTNEGSYKDLVTKLLRKGRKLKNLLLEEVPEDPINRELKDTQYISRKLKEKLAELVGESNVWTTTGSITDILRESWHLNEVMKELLKDRYEAFKISLGIGKEPTYAKLNYTDKIINKKTEKEEPIDVYPSYSKRLDHRHHAIDAFIIACTKQWHIQYVNTMNAANSVDISMENEKKIKAIKLKKLICKKSTENDFKAYDFAYPWKEYNKTQIENILKEVVVAHKNKNILISPSKHRIKKNGVVITVKRKDGSLDKPISIRGQLHNETIIGKRKFFNPTTKSIEAIIEDIFLRRQNARNNLKVGSKNCFFMHNSRKA